MAMHGSFTKAMLGSRDKTPTVSSKWNMTWHGWCTSNTMASGTSVPCCVETGHVKFSHWDDMIPTYFPPCSRTPVRKIEGSFLYSSERRISSHLYADDIAVQRLSPGEGLKTAGSRSRTNLGVNSATNRMMKCQLHISYIYTYTPETQTRTYM